MRITGTGVSVTGTLAATGAVSGSNLSGTNTGDQTTVSGQAGFVANSVTFAASGGAAAGTTYNGSAARTIDYSTVGALPAAPRIQSVSSSATVTPTFANDQVIITAQAVGLTLANPTGTAAEGKTLIIRIKDNGSAQTIGYGTQYRAIGVTLPTTTVSSKTLYLGLVFNNTDTKWDVVAVSQEA
jgi:hypothetical protein